MIEKYIKKCFQLEIQSNYVKDNLPVISMLLSDSLLVFLDKQRFWWAKVLFIVFRSSNKQSNLNPIRPGWGGFHPPLCFFRITLKPHNLASWNFANFPENCGHFWIYTFFCIIFDLGCRGSLFVTENWPKNGDFQNIWKFLLTFSAEISMFT